MGFASCYDARPSWRAVHLFDVPPAFLKPEFLLKQLGEIGFRLGGFCQQLVFAVAA